MPMSGKPDIGGRASFEGRLLRPPQDDGSKTVLGPAKVQTLTVSPDESGMRVDRFFEARFPGLSFSHIQRIVRKGEVRVNGKRNEGAARSRAERARTAAVA
jgi:23S rRNA pseudouridine955/2504/2580 synthase